MKLMLIILQSGTWRAWAMAHLFLAQTPRPFGLSSSRPPLTNRPLLFLHNLLHTLGLPTTSRSSPRSSRSRPLLLLLLLLALLSLLLLLHLLLPLYLFKAPRLGQCFKTRHLSDRGEQHVSV